MCNRSINCKLHSLNRRRYIWKSYS
ncbi:hypothetical protein COI93_10520 [Bacillus cereus]|uniref:SCA7 domain-containing protein n=1 Tax=Bacillus cereus TaxID=1396 RepID=A0A2B0MFE7_BACCE|nr:hypothetical protein COI93_10520 [Bacillus cereus]